MNEYIIRLSHKNRPFREIFVEAKDVETATEFLDEEHRRWLDKGLEDLTSNLYEIRWINGI